MVIFWKVIVGYKNKNYRSNRGLKNNKQKLKKMIIVKIYLGLYLVLWTVWGQFIFR